VPFSGATKLAIATQGAHVLAMRNGTVWSWGHNLYGQVGDGTNINREYPVQIDDFMFVTDVSAGGSTSLALKQDGTVWSWGNNDHGQLGTGSTLPATSNRPVRVANLSSVTAISAGSSHSLALKSDGTVWAWGWNPLGELGIGTTDFDAHPTPVQVPGLSNIVKIFAGDSISYAIKTDGTVFGWGFAFLGKLGDGGSGSIISSPLAIPSLSGAIAFASGGGATLARKQDGTVLSYGHNLLGRLGRGLVNFDIFPVPTQISDLLATSATAGGVHFMVAEPGGTVKVFGGNDSGQLGLGFTDSSPHPSPVLVPGLTNVFETAAGALSSFALVGNANTGGTVRAWGSNRFGVLGLGIPGNPTTPPYTKIATVPENPTVARPMFSVPEGTTFATQVLVVCGTPGAVIHYTTNGNDPTESDPVVVSGATVTVDHSLTLKARAFRSGFSTSDVKSAVYTVVAMPPLQLLLDSSGPALDQAAALEALRFLRDPFPVLSPDNLLNLGSDKNTRVVVFVNNILLAPGEGFPPVVVSLVDNNSQMFDVAAEDVRFIPNLEFVQVTFRLPNNLAVGSCTLQIKAQGRMSNTGTIRIR